MRSPSLGLSVHKCSEKAMAKCHALATSLWNCRFKAPKRYCKVDFNKYNSKKKLFYPAGPITARQSGGVRLTSPFAFTT